MSLRLCYGSHHSYITGHYVCVRASPQLHRTSLHLWYGRPHSYVTTSVLGRPHSYIVRHYICDTGIPTATSGITVSVIQASPQLHHKSLHLWHRHPHSYLRRHCVCDTGVCTVTSYVTSLWHGHPRIYIICHCICDLGIPTVTSQVITSVTWASPQLPHTSLCLWYECQHSYLICHRYRRPYIDVISHYICDTSVPTVMSYVTASVIWASPQLYQRSLRLWHGRPYIYLIHHWVCDTGVPSYVIRHCIWYGRSYSTSYVCYKHWGGNEDAYNHHQELPHASLRTTATCVIHMLLRLWGWLSSGTSQPSRWDSI